MRQQVLWKCILNDGSEAWSDFDVPNQKDPWTRLRHYCYNNNIEIKEVRVVVPGNPEQVVFTGDPYLNNIMIVRGTAKDINDSGETIYSFMTFGKVEDDGLIHVKRFYWPECHFGTYQEVREITPENKLLLYTKNKCGDSCKCQSNEQK
jgi:hypothetical protein